jgi:hypothetical protein
MTLDEVNNLPASRDTDCAVSEILTGLDRSQTPFPPAYSTDLQAAWRGLDRFLEKNPFLISNVGTHDDANDFRRKPGYGCLICGTLGDSHDSKQYVYSEASAETPALAICRSIAKVFVVGPTDNTTDYGPPKPKEDPIALARKVRDAAAQLVSTFDEFEGKDGTLGEPMDRLIIAMTELEENSE